MKKEYHLRVTTKRRQLHILIAITDLFACQIQMLFGFWHYILKEHLDCCASVQLPRCLPRMNAVADYESDRLKVSFERLPAFRPGPSQPLWHFLLTIGSVRRAASTATIVLSLIFVKKQQTRKSIDTSWKQREKRRWGRQIPQLQLQCRQHYSVSLTVGASKSLGNSSLGWRQGSCTNDA